MKHPVCPHCGQAMPPVDQPEVPAGLRTVGFLAAWGDWIAYRKEIKKKLTPLTTKKQLELLASWGPARATLAIETSIRNGWQGLFEPREPAANEWDRFLGDAP